MHVYVWVASRHLIVTSSLTVIPVTIHGIFLCYLFFEPSILNCLTLFVKCSFVKQRSVIQPILSHGHSCLIWSAHVTSHSLSRDVSGSQYAFCTGEITPGLGDYVSNHHTEYNTSPYSSDPSSSWINTPRLLAKCFSHPFPYSFHFIKGIGENPSG